MVAAGSGLDFIFGSNKRENCSKGSPSNVWRRTPIIGQFQGHLSAFLHYSGVKHSVKEELAELKDLKRVKRPYVRLRIGHEL